METEKKIETLHLENAEVVAKTDEYESYVRSHPPLRDLTRR